MYVQRTKRNTAIDMYCTHIIDVLVVAVFIAERPFNEKNLLAVLFS